MLTLQIIARFISDEREVIRDVRHRFQNQWPQDDESRFAVDRGALPCCGEGFESVTNRMARHYNAAIEGTSFTRVERACRAIWWRISLTVVQQSGRIVTWYFSAAFEIAVWVTQFCVIIPQTSK